MYYFTIVYVITYVCGKLSYLFGISFLICLEYHSLSVGSFLCVESYPICLEYFIEWYGYPTSVECSYMLVKVLQW
jgi:hypothetical protein